MSAGLPRDPAPSACLLPAFLLVQEPGREPCILPHSKALLATPLASPTTLSGPAPLEASMQVTQPFLPGTLNVLQCPHCD